MTLEERLLSKVLYEDRGFTSECWVWRAGKFWSGYGKVQLSSPRRTRRAHCAAYEVWVGPIPEGLQVNHHCDQPDCINPDHLYAGTPAQNSADMVERGRQRGNGYDKKTHCKRGHEFSSENTYIKRNGGRQCRVCDRQR